MIKMQKRLWSLLLAACLVATMMPTMAFAADKTVNTEEELKAAIANAQNGDTITLEQNIEITAPIVVANKTITLNLDRHTISAESEIWNESDGRWSLIEAAEGSDLTITGSGKLQTIKNDTYAIDLINGGKCTIQNGEIIGNVHAVYVLAGELTVNGGTFSVQQVFSQDQPYQFVLNCHDASYKNGTAKITVNGGSFVGFNPRNCEAEGKGTNFCSSGCTITVDESTDPDTYTVTKVEEGQMIVVPEQSNAQEVSASLEGTFTSSTEKVTATSPDGSQAAGENQLSGKVENKTVTVTLPKVTNATTASLNVAGETVSSMADNSGSLTFKSDVGNLEVSNDALKTISGNAKGSAVTLSIEKKTQTGAAESTATYELTAKDAAGNEVFAKDENTENGNITVSVPKPSGVTGSVYVYYLGSDGAEKVEGATVDDNNVVWTVNHFSTYYITATEQGVSVTDENETTTTYATLQEAISAANAGDTIKLLTNVTVDAPTGNMGAGAITIEENITLDGNGNTISIDTGFEATGGDKWDKDLGKYHVINVLSNATIQNVIIDGGWDGTETSGDPNYSAARSGINIWNTDSTQLKVELTGVTVNKCSVYAVTAKGADLTITNLTTSGNQWGVNVEDNSNVDIQTSNISEDIVYESSSADSTLDINGGTYGTVKTQGNDTAGNVQITGDANVNTVENGSDTSTNMVVSGSTVNTVTNSGSGNFSVLYSTVTGTAPTADGGITMVSCVGGNGNELANVVSGNTVAVYNGTAYADLSTALNNASGKGGTVYLVANANLETVIPANTTLDVAKNVTLTIAQEKLNTLIGSAGKIKVNAGGALVVDSTNMIGGSNANINLTKGYIDVSVVNSSSLKLDFVGATAEVPENQRWTLSKKISDSFTIPMNVTLDNSTTLTVTSTGDDTEDDGFRVANDATLTNNGKVVVNGVMSISSEGKVDGSGTITVGSSGVLVVNKSESGGSVGTLDNTVTNNGTFVWNGSTGTPNKTITLASGGKVYSQSDISGKLKNYRELSGKKYDGTDYTYAWEYYVSSSTSGGGGGGGGTSTYSVSTSSTTNGTISVSPKSAAKGAKVTITVKPNTGYELDTLTVKDADGKAVELTKVSDTEYTFKMPASKVTISATFAAETVEPTSPFSDVATSAYYYDAVLWAVENDITNGTTASTFSPNADVSRAQMVTFLWRAAGSPKATGVNPFTDVKSSDYYYDAVLWAVANGVTNGTTETTFSPAKAVSRAQAVTFQWRAAGSPAASANSFADVAADAYYADAVTWAVANEITNGMSATSFGPDVTVTRAQAVTFLYREAN